MVMNSTGREYLSLASSQRSGSRVAPTSTGGRRATTGNTVLERELIRSEQTYSQIKDDRKWSQKTINLALEFLSINQTYLEEKLGGFTLVSSPQLMRSESHSISPRMRRSSHDSADL